MLGLMWGFMLVIMTKDITHDATKYIRYSDDNAGGGEEVWRVRITR
jgi:hypothetical protein